MNKQLHLINTYSGLILNGLISGFCIMLMRNYFLSVPYSLAESARMDNAGEVRIFASIYMPISLPGAATIFFLEFVGKWNSLDAAGHIDFGAGALHTAPDAQANDSEPVQRFRHHPSAGRTPSWPPL